MTALNKRLKSLLQLPNRGLGSLEQGVEVTLLDPGSNTGGDPSGLGYTYGRFPLFPLKLKVLVMVSRMLTGGYYLWIAAQLACHHHTFYNVSHSLWFTNML